MDFSLLHTPKDIANDFFESNSDFLKRESEDDNALYKIVGNFVYISCYVKTNTSFNYNVIYGPGLVKTKEAAFTEDNYWSDFNKGAQFSKSITDDGIGNALVIIGKCSLSIYNIYFFKDEYNFDFPVLLLDYVDNKLIVNYFEFDYVFEDGIYTFLSFVDSTFLKLDYIWIAHPTDGYDASSNWHFINFKEMVEYPIHIIEEEPSIEYKDCHYDFDNNLFVFSSEFKCLKIDYKTLISVTEDDRLYFERQRKMRDLEEMKCRADMQMRLDEFRKLNDELQLSVSSWTILNGNFHYDYLFYYFPTTCEFQVTDEEWKNRHLIWNFKNEPENNILPSAHEAAQEIVVAEIKQKLLKSFGEKNLNYLTLVCLPASTHSKNWARYYDFSKRLCSETFMKNAFPFIHIMKDGMSKKHPKNHTGHSIQPEIKYEEDFFKGRYVLLFDDVITKGETMLRYKKAMEDLGAIVIGGMCLGKTKHERPVQSGQYPNEYDEELPF